MAPARYPSELVLPAGCSIAATARVGRSGRGPGCSRDATGAAAGSAALGREQGPAQPIPHRRPTCRIDHPGSPWNLAARREGLGGGRTVRPSGKIPCRLLETNIRVRGTFSGHASTDAVRRGQPGSGQLIPVTVAPIEARSCPPPRGTPAIGRLHCEDGQPYIAALQPASAGSMAVQVRQSERFHPLSSGATS